MKRNLNNTLLSVSKKIFQVLLLFLFVLGIIVTIIGAMLGISMVKVAEKSPDIDPNNILLSLNENSRIYDKDGKLIESIALDEYRELLKHKDIPKHLLDAIVAIEDERFYKHIGIDPIGIIRAIIQNMKSSNIVEGGSTITQQLVKNVYLTNEVKWDRKIKEMYLALKVEKTLSKDQILEAYLNRVFLGQHAYGVEAAAQTYFSKSAKDLTLAESATIAAIAQSPSSFSLFKAYKPSTVPENAETAGEYSSVGMKFVAVKNDKVIPRKNLVLNNMLKQGFITQEEYDKAKDEDVMASVKAGTKKVADIPSQISNYIKTEAINHIMESQKLNKDEARNLLYTGGLNIYTTIDWDAQKKLEETYENFTNLFKKNNGNPRKQVQLDENKNIIANGKTLFYKEDNLLTKNNEIYVPKGYFNVSDNGDLKIEASRLARTKYGFYVSPFYKINDKDEIVTYNVSSVELPEESVEKTNNGFTIKSEYLKKVKDFYRIEDNKLVINKKYYNVQTEGTVQPQSSTVIIDSRTADIVAMVGKRGNSKDNTIDRATNYPRPTASVIKPLLVYGPAIESGRTLASPVDDTPLQMLNNKPWPQNVYHGYKGIVTTREALRQSMNAPAVKIFNDEVGIENAKEYLKKYGIISETNPENDNFITKAENPKQNDENLALSIGAMSKGFTVKEVASAFQTLANNGERIKSTIISKISAKDKDIYIKDDKPIKIFSKETTFLVTDVLKDLVSGSYYKGTTNSYRIDTAGKTGTSDSNNDFWFSGYNPYYTATTWIGYDDSRLTMPGSSNLAAKFFGMYMNKILEGKESANFEKPKNITQAEVSAVDGLLPNEYTSRDPRGSKIITEYFRKNYVPSVKSNSHVLLNVDRRNNLIAQENTPSSFVYQKVFINRPIKYDPQKFNGLVPDDWAYNAPTKVSNLPWTDVTTTKTLEDGTIIETTTKANGVVVVKQSRPDGITIIQTTNLDGSVSTEIIRPETENETNQENQDSEETNKEEDLED